MVSDVYYTKVVLGMTANDYRELATLLSKARQDKQGTIPAVISEANDDQTLYNAMLIAIHCSGYRN